MSKKVSILDILTMMMLVLVAKINSEHLYEIEFFFFKLRFKIRCSLNI